jgi:hypothetical protein
MLHIGGEPKQRTRMKNLADSISEKKTTNTTVERL